MAMSEKESDGYAWEKGFLAVQGMATSARTIQERVGDAYIYHLVHIREENVSPELFERIEAIGQRLTREKAIGDEGTVAATVAKMSEADAIKIADEIVSIYDEIARGYGQH